MTKLARKMHRCRQSGHHAWPSDWDAVPVPNTDFEAAVLTAECAGRLSIMTDKLRQEKALRGLRHAKRLGRVILLSDSARIAALAVAVNREIFFGIPAVSRAIVENALRLDMWADSGEAVRWKVYDSPTGKNRINYSFGHLEYARQYLAKRVAEVMADLSPRQFITRGGMPAMIAWMNTHVPKAKVVITTDVPNCFFVLIREHIEAGMPLPGRVTRSILFEPMDRARRRAFVPGDSEGNSYPENPSHYGCGAESARGIPRGSALASLAAEVSLRHILDAVEDAADGVMVAIYGDNIIILAPSDKAADASVSALRDAARDRIGERAVEELCTRIVRSKRPKGFDFVKSHFTVRKGVLHRRCLPGFEENFEIKLCVEFMNGEIDEEDALRRIKGFAHACSYDPKAAAVVERMIKKWGPSD